jgi:hypothetical protein
VAELDDEEPTDILGMVVGSAEEDEADDGDAKTRAVEDLFAAMKKGDAKAGAAAFKRAYDACAMKGESDDEPADEGDEYPEE